MLIYLVFIIVVMTVTGVILGLHELSSICQATPHCTGA